MCSTYYTEEAWEGQSKEDFPMGQAVAGFLCGNVIWDQRASSVLCASFLGGVCLIRFQKPVVQMFKFTM
ncbi:hypothetical protein OPV22_021649 [Ensete ventricosum]|uniref:Uncharacterized protein n=1 Tax=Ensete ventricosum TaxID=4639 RepID=A0AAV8QR30_ENSVE|nr:hypothetical protein OPV22_021649 [Ensete ventricosum]